MTNDNKSFIAKIAESILKSTKADYMGSLELSKELLDTRLKQEDKPVKRFIDIYQDVLDYVDRDVETLMRLL